MSRRNIEERISAKYRQRLGKTSLNRLDLVLADHEMIDKNNTTAKVLIAYNPLHGEPKKEDIERFVWATFDQKLMPVMETARVHTKKDVVELVVEPVRSTKSFENSKKMAAIVPGKRYVDSEGAVWSVKASEDGTKFLIRNSEENIDEILQERRKYMNAGATLPTLRSLNKTAGYVNAQEGDVVEFYHGTSPMQGKILSIGKDNTVKVSVGKIVMTIPRPSILRVIEHSPTYKKMKTDLLKSYFERYLGPELASKLVSPGSNEAEGSGATNR